MTAPHPPATRDISPLEAFEAALDWWREAGLVCDFTDEAQGWLEDASPPVDATAPAPPPPRPAAPPPRSALERALENEPAARAIGGEPADWPQTLENFRHWWMTEPSLADGALDRRLPPRGVAGARLMAIVPQPLGSDREALAEGPAGRFLAAICAACGIAAHETYLASILPAPTTLPDWQALAAAGMGEVLRHHVALAAPERVLLFGRSAGAVLGLDPVKAREPFVITTAGRAIPALAVPDLAELARVPARRQRFWQTWLDWTR